MATQTQTRTAMAGSRHGALRTMLQNRRQVLKREVQASIRDARRSGAEERGVLDEIDGSDADIQDAMSFAVLELKAATLLQIETALRRLDEGRYGHCHACGVAIAHARLRALPFAVRCKECEDAHEMAAQRDRLAARHRSAPGPVDAVAT